MSGGNSSENFTCDNCSYGEPGFALCQAGLALNAYIVPFILAAGIFGNVFSFAVMMNSTNRQVTCCLFFAALAVSDNTVLFGAIVHKIKENFSMDTSVCSFYAFLANSGSACSSYFITIITFLRFEAVCKIFKKKLRITKKMAMLLILLLVVVCTLTNIPCIFTAKLLSRTACASYASLSPVSSIWVWGMTISFFLIPLVLVTYWNVRIYLALRKRRQSGMDSTASNSIPLSGFVVYTREDSAGSQTNTRMNSNKSNRDTERKLTKMMVFISLAFIFLSLPQYVRYAFYLIVEPKDIHGKAVRFLVYHLTNKLFIMNHAINFYLYCLSGAKFRNDFVKLITMPFKRMTGN